MSETPAVLPPTPASPGAARRRTQSRLLRIVDSLTYGSAMGGTLLLIGALGLAAATIIVGGWPAIKQFGWHFLVTSKWNPVTAQFGAWPFIYTTLVTSLLALLISIPVSVGSAIFLVKLAPKVRIPVPAGLLGRRSSTGWALLNPRYVVTVTSFLVELLAAIPSIAYGLWGIAVLVPFMQEHVQPFLGTRVQSWTGPACLELARWTALPAWGILLMWELGTLFILGGAITWLVGVFLGEHGWTVRRAARWALTAGVLSFFFTVLPHVLGAASEFFVNTGSGYNILTASIVLAIMVTPIMTAIIRDVLAVVPPELEQGALGLGATWWQAMKLVLGFSKMGIFGAVVLGFARAMGETMAVTMIIGNANSAGFSLFSPGQTIASKLANQFNNADTDAEVYALFYAALVLLLITMMINGFARVVLLRASMGRKRK